MKKKILPVSLIAIFSIALWGSVSLSGDYFNTIKLPLRFIDLPDNYAVGGTSATEISVTVKAQGWELTKLTLGGGIYFNISAAGKTGLQKVQLKDEIINNSWIGGNVQLVEVSPAQIEFRVEKVTRKKVPVASSLKLSYRAGYAGVSDLSFTPDSVIIYGAQSLVAKIDTVRTEAADFPDLDANLNAVVQLQEIPGITLDQSQCNAEINVQKIVDKTFENLAVETRNVPHSRDLILFPGKVSVTLRGGINILGKMNGDELKPYVDFWSALKDESGSVEPVMAVPKFTRLISVSPLKLEYIIKQY